MGYHSSLRLIAYSVIFFTSLTFSCQDHQLPDPVTNCVRLDGSHRAFNCEFEFVKAEFYRADYDPERQPRYDTIVYATATPANPKVVIKEPRYANWVISSHSNFYFISLPVRVTIRRLAPPPSSPATYILRQNMAVGSDGSEYPTTKDFELPADETFQPVKIDIPVGKTFTYSTTYNWVGNAVDNGPVVDYMLNGSSDYLVVQNAETSKILRKLPYNYSLYRDIAEAKLLFQPNIIPSSDPFRMSAVK